MKKFTLFSIALLLSASYKASAYVNTVEHAVAVRTTSPEVAMHKIGVKIAAEEVKESAHDVGVAASNLGQAAAELAGDAAHLASETAQLATKKVVAVGTYAERRAEVVAHDVATTAEDVANTVGGFATVSAVSAASQVPQVISATAQYADKLLYPAAFTVLGYYTYKHGIKPHLPELNLKTKAYELQHPNVTTLRETGASLLTGGVLFAAAYGLLTRPSVAAFLNKNMPNTSSLLGHVVGRERTLILNTLQEPGF